MRERSQEGVIGAIKIDRWTTENFTPLFSKWKEENE